MSRGVALVEMAFVGLFIISIIAGTFDFGMGWRAGMTITEAARTGARVGSGQSVSPGADYYALSGMQASLSASGKIDDVERVVIFKATSTTGAVPPACTTGNAGGCNVLTGPQFKSLTVMSFNLVVSPLPGVEPTGTGCLKVGYAGWCPNARINDPQGSADYYGVWVKYRQRNLFPISGPDRFITRTAVMRLEPKTD